MPDSYELLAKADNTGYTLRKTDGNGNVSQTEMPINKLVLDSLAEIGTVVNGNVYTNIKPLLKDIAMGDMVKDLQATSSEVAVSAYRHIKRMYDEVAYGRPKHSTAVTKDAAYNRLLRIKERVNKLLEVFIEERVRVRSGSVSHNIASFKKVFIESGDNPLSLSSDFIPPPLPTKGRRILDDYGVQSIAHGAEKCDPGSAGGKDEVWPPNMNDVLIMRDELLYFAGLPNTDTDQLWESYTKARNPKDINRFLFKLCSGFEWGREYPTAVTPVWHEVSYLNKEYKRAEDSPVFPALPDIVAEGNPAKNKKLLPGKIYDANDQYAGSALNFKFRGDLCQEKVYAMYRAMNSEISSMIVTADETVMVQCQLDMSPCIVTKNDGGGIGRTVFYNPYPRPENAFISKVTILINEIRSRNNNQKECLSAEIILYDGLTMRGRFAPNLTIGRRRVEEDTRSSGGSQYALMCYDEIIDSAKSKIDDLNERLEQLLVTTTLIAQNAYATAENSAVLADFLEKKYLKFTQDASYFLTPMYIVVSSSYKNETQSGKVLVDVEYRCAKTDVGKKLAEDFGLLAHYISTGFGVSSFTGGSKRKRSTISQKDPSVKPTKSAKLTNMVKYYGLSRQYISSTEDRVLKILSFFIFSIPIRSLEEYLQEYQIESEEDQYTFRVKIITELYTLFSHMCIYPYPFYKLRSSAPSDDSNESTLSVLIDDHDIPITHDNPVIPAGFIYRIPRRSNGIFVYEELERIIDYDSTLQCLINVFKSHPVTHSIITDMDTQQLVDIVYMERWNIILPVDIYTSQDDESTSQDDESVIDTGVFKLICRRNQPEEPYTVRDTFSSGLIDGIISSHVSNAVRTYTIDNFGSAIELYSRIMEKVRITGIQDFFQLFEKLDNLLSIFPFYKFALIQTLVQMFDPEMSYRFFDYDSTYILLLFLFTTTPDLTRFLTIFLNILFFRISNSIYYNLKNYLDKFQEIINEIEKMRILLTSKMSLDLLVIEIDGVIKPFPMLLINLALQFLRVPDDELAIITANYEVNDDETPGLPVTNRNILEGNLKKDGLTPPQYKCVDFPRPSELLDIDQIPKSFLSNISLTSGLEVAYPYRMESLKAVSSILSEMAVQSIDQVKDFVGRQILVLVSGSASAVSGSASAVSGSALAVSGSALASRSSMTSPRSITTFPGYDVLHQSPLEVNTSPLLKAGGHMRKTKKYNRKKSKKTRKNHKTYYSLN